MTVRIALDGRYIQDHFPGIGRYAYELARHLPPRAPETEFLLLRNRRASNTRFDWDALLCHPNVREIVVESSPFALSQQWELRRALGRQAVGLYHSPYYLMPYLLPCKTVATIHDLIPLRFPESLPHPHLAPAYRALVQLCARRADHLIVDSDATLADLEQDQLIRDANATRVYLGVEPHFAPPPAQALDSYYVESGLGRPYVLYLGINKPHKNLLTLLQAWALVAEPLRNAHPLVLAGPQDARYGRGHALIEELGLSGSVHVLGRIAEEALPLLYAGAACFVFPSLYEGFGLPIVEAMACGAPVACSNASSLPEVAGDAALFFDPSSESEIAAALTRLLGDAHMRGRFAAAGSARAQLFTWERTAAETLAVYRRLLCQ